MTLPSIFLMGPTAAGKTELAVTLVKHFPCDIISVDSAMVYRGMDIGTAKPNADTLAQAPHRLIDICDPVESYSVAQFYQAAYAEIQAIQLTGRIPLLVGGTMLYFHRLQHGLATLPSADPQVRQRLNQEAQELGWSTLHQRLARLDPESAQRIHPHDSQRIQRALEVYEISGRTMTAWYTKATTRPELPSVMKLVISPAQRAVLHVKIAQRFQAMLAQGFIEEVYHLFRRGDLTPDLPAMRCVGYRQIWQYLTGELNYDNLSEQAISATRQMAKRQLTWLRTQTDAIWFDNQQHHLTKNILNYIEKKLLLPKTVKTIAGYV